MTTSIVPVLTIAIASSVGGVIIIGLIVILFFLTLIYLKGIINKLYFTYCTINFFRKVLLETQKVSKSVIVNTESHYFYVIFKVL